MDAPKKLILIDAYALIFRAYYAFIKNPRITSYGLNTNAIYGFTTTLLDVLEKFNPSHIAVCFDHKSTNIRKQEFEFYKANRDETPEDIKRSEPYIREIIQGFNIPILEKEGYEADDVIVTLAQKGAEKGFQVLMMTPDKDFGQAVSDNIKMLIPAKGGNPPEILGPAEVCLKFDVDNPAQIIDLLGLMGDAADNIPGVPGVGPKTAITLLKQYGSIEKIYENTADLKGKLKEKIEENKESAFISKRLATIITDVPIEFVEEDLILEQANSKVLKDLFEKLEFRSLTKRVYGEPSTSGKVVQMSLFDVPSVSDNVVNEVVKESSLKSFDKQNVNYILIQKKEELIVLCEDLLKQRYVCFDTETTSLVELDAQLVGISFCYEKGQAYYVTMPSNFEEAKERIHLFKPFFESESIEKIAQNIKYDLKVLKKYDIQIKGAIFDTMLAHYLVNPDGRHSMDILSEKYLNYTPISISELIGKKGVNQMKFSDVPLEKATNYAAEDADITFQLKAPLYEELMQKEVAHLLYTIEQPLVHVLADMEMEGIKVDDAFLNEYSVELEKLATELEKVIYEISGCQFNLASPKQLGEVLFDVMKLDNKAKKTKTGQYKTDEDTLQNLSGSHSIIGKLLDYRKIMKLKSTYVDALPKLIHPKTGRVHTSFAQAVAATGRLSSSNPNLQNIPIRTEQGREIRKAFIPRDENHTLVAIDYSQIELRIVASISKDDGLKGAFSQGLDIHAATAAKIFKVPLEEVTKEQRYKAKSVNFGLIYGQGAFGLSKNLGIARKEAQELIDAYFEEFGGVKNYMDETISFCRNHGYVKTLLGRRRYIPDINSANQTVVGFAERNAINAPIQGSAADMIKLAMIKIHKRLNAENWKAKMILQVHDELIFDVPNDELEALIPMVKSEMERAMPLEVPIVAEAGMGANWLEAH
jgi:DNA polymerase I